MLPKFNGFSHGNSLSKKNRTERFAKGVSKSLREKARVSASQKEFADHSARKQRVSAS
ncbi:hypothetical protein [Cytobacillus kochii]|uniref:hypothetical protein n=1 Tax=Cytobacillus kochii TaxID=859143 RepID=UPI0025A0D47E|nr:hypothetical protein [Cytobacillus kochii]MDM5206660.1 hypothetical protein [Cytobacillus kochii]